MIGQTILKMHLFLDISASANWMLGSSALFETDFSMNHQADNMTTQQSLRVIKLYDKLIKTTAQIVE